MGWKAPLPDHIAARSSPGAFCTSYDICDFGLLKLYEPVPGEEHTTRRYGGYGKDAGIGKATEGQTYRGIIVLIFRLILCLVVGLCAVRAVTNHGMVTKILLTHSLSLKSPSGSRFFRSSTTAVAAGIV